MINEDRVKEITQIAVYEQNAGEVQENIKTYFKSDFVGKEIIKSFFTGSIAFVCIAAMYLMYRSPELVDQINHLDFMEIGTWAVIVYFVFMVVYMFITLLVYTIKYNYEHRKFKKYGDHIKALNKIYERDESLR